jgi:hypothetical protein
MDNNHSYEMANEPLRFETLLTNLSTLFINFPSTFVGSQIENGLRIIVEFVDMDKGILAFFDEDSRAVRTVSSYTVAGIEFPGSMDLSSCFTLSADCHREISDDKES